MIQKFRKKPVVIEAVQLLNTPASIYECQNFIDGGIVDNHSCKAAEENWDIYISIVKKQGGIRLKTLESDNETQIANFGDFIIKGVNGEFYPCKPDIFEKTYEPTD